MRHLLKVNLLIAALIMPFSAQAQNFAIGGGIGTLGPEVFLTRKVTKNFDLLLGFSSLDYDDTFTDADANSFKANATIEAPRIGVQFYPLSSFGLFLEGGMVFGAPEIGIEYEADENAQFDVGGTIYNASDIGTLTGSTGFDTDSAPYFLAGFGRTVGGGLGLSISAGAIAYGAMNVDLKNSQCTLGDNILTRTQLCGALQTNLLIEEARINADLEEFELWPFLRIGLSYSF